MYKSRLHKLCQKRKWKLPDYAITQHGLDHMPSFTASVTVRGQVFESPSQCKSAKEARNTAAQVAINHFRIPPPRAVNHLPPSTLAPTAVNYTFHAVLPDAPLPVAPPVIPMRLVAAVPPRRLPRPLPLTPSPSSLPLPSADLLRMHKKQLPMLSVDIIDEEEYLYKNLLQEFALKEGLLPPSYQIRSKPIFVSTVEIGTASFQGVQAKTKKQAEMNAAKAAYWVLTEGCSAMKSSPSINECPVADNLSQNIQPTATLKRHQDATGEDIDYTSEAHLHAKRAKLLQHPSRSDSSSDASNLLNSQAYCSTSTEPVTFGKSKTSPMFH